ncbi:MAG: hypothetical protein ACK4YM_00430 [Novosphingobium sp.]
MDQRQSRRTLIGLVLLGLLLLASPLLWQVWTISTELDGKTKVFDVASPRPLSAVLACLVKRPTSGLSLSIISPNHFADRTRGLVVRLEPRGQGSRLRAWMPDGADLSAGERAQLEGCAA